MTVLSLLVVLAVGIAFFCCPLLSLTFGIVALRKIKHSKGALKGTGMAWTGIVFGIIGCLGTPIIMVLLLFAPSATMSVDPTLEAPGGRMEMNQTVETAPGIEGEASLAAESGI